MRHILSVAGLLVLTVGFSACSQPATTTPEANTDSTAQEQSSLKGTLALDKDTFTTVDDIAVTFEVTGGEVDSSAWIGIVPKGTGHSEAEADMEDVSYAYLVNAEEDVVTLGPVSTPGDYEVRLFSADGAGAVELASEAITITEGGDVADPDAPLTTSVTKGDYSLSLDATTFAPGDEINLMYTTPEGLSTSAWIGVIPSDIAHGSEATNDMHDLAYQYLDGNVEDILTFEAPEEAGRYDFRLNSSDGSGEEMISITFEVK